MPVAIIETGRFKSLICPLNVENQDYPILWAGLIFNIYFRNQDLKNFTNQKQRLLKRTLL